MAFYEITPEQGRDIWILERDGQPKPFIATPYNERSPAFSPDGQWLAFVSDESGRDEVYVQPFPGPGVKRQVSSGGGRSPVWSKSESELYYRKDGGMYAVQVATPLSTQAAPRLLFTENYDAEQGPSGSVNYDVTPNGLTFLMVSSDPPSEVYIVLNWLTELRRLFDQR